MKTHSSPSTSAITLFGKSLLLGLVLAFFFLLAINLAAGIAYSNRIFPGITSSGISLAGLKPGQAAALLTVTPGYAEKGHITFVYGENRWEATPAQLGIFMDPQATSTTAFKTGRSGSILTILRDRLQLLRHTVDVPPSYLYNESIAVAYLESIAAEINQPLREASLEISGTDVIVSNGQPGQVLDIPATLVELSAQLEMMRDAEIPLVVHESKPLLLDASAQAELARTILSAPFHLSLPADLNAGDQEWLLEPALLAKMLTFEQVSNGQTTDLRLVVSTPLMTGYLESLRDETDSQPSNPRFIFNDDSKQLDLLTPAVIGRKLNTAATIDAINTNLNEGKHKAKLVFDLTPPAVTDGMSGEDLGITELVYAYTSYFRGSTSDRVQNIETAAAAFHGLLVPPGGILSMSDELGDISLENGYAEAAIILGDETIQGVGGGVCQVSTTLFRTVYYAGYPVLERHPHAYRVGYYEQTANGHDPDLAGLDATVFVPLVDFKFQNDTDHWLLMETYINRSNYSLTWKFYSTKDGRQVESTSSGLTNIVKAPDPLYRENPELAKGETKQVDWAVDGATVIIKRTVTRNGTILYQDTFSTIYQPWRDIFDYGPGTENMPPEKTSADSN